MIEQIERLRALMRRTEARPHPPAHAVTPPAFAPVDTPWGPAYVRHRRLQLGQRHGGYRLGELADLSASGLGFLVGGARVAPEELLFLDTETTGLGGAGTCVFLVGTARLDGDALALSQLFLPGPAEEPGFLHLLADGWPPPPYLVTYNGKAFDWPVLCDRYVLLGQAPPPIAGELDLLTWARRFYRHTLGGCSLVDLEQQVLGSFRPADIPGHRVPAAYFDYLRSGDLGPLEPVFEHNQNDVLSLVTLCCEFVAYVEERMRPTCAGPVAYALGRVYEQRGQPGPAGRCYREALAAGLPDGLRVAALRRLGMLCKRCGDWEGARRAFGEVLELTGADVVACEELAKYYEHRAGDLTAATGLVQRALAGAEGRRQPWRSRLQHRLGRLDRKRSGR